MPSDETGDEEVPEIHPGVVLGPGEARTVLLALARSPGQWHLEPGRWVRIQSVGGASVGGASVGGASVAVGSLDVSPGLPRRLELLIRSVTLTHAGARLGWTPSSVCDDALAAAGTTLASARRAGLLGAGPAPGDRDR